MVSVCEDDYESYLTDEAKSALQVDSRRIIKKNLAGGGNDYLYRFCFYSPIPKPECTKHEKGETSKLESEFAGKMWLIGRAYAASPERYAYVFESADLPKKKFRTKPGEGFLGDEGYESFFEDISRMLFRDECHDSKNPVAYLRGERYCISEGSIKYAVATLGSSNLIDSIGKDKLKKLREIACNASGALKDFCALQDGLHSLVVQRGPAFNDGSNHYSFEEEFDSSCFERDRKTTVNHSSSVVRFAMAISMARTLRDIAVILKSIGRLDEQESEARKKKLAKLLPMWVEAVAGVQGLNVSFSSKFLHFHYPQVFFIYDSISSRKLKSITTALTGLEDDREDKNEDFADGTPYAGRCKEWIEKYRIHSIKELAVAYAICEKLNERERPEDLELLNALRHDDSRAKARAGLSRVSPYLSITRLVDELVTNAVVRP